jgi:hypothetical protein
VGTDPWAWLPLSLYMEYVYIWLWGGDMNRLEDMSPGPSHWGWGLTQGNATCMAVIVSSYGISLYMVMGWGYELFRYYDVIDSV